MDNQQGQFDYRVKAIQDESRMCKITAAEVEIPIACAAPPGFPNGVPGVWSPETFFLAAIAGCSVHNFQLFCNKPKLQPVSLECEASGTVALVDGKPAFTQVMLNPIITLANYEDEALALHIMEEAQHYCLISNSHQQQFRSLQRCNPVQDVFWQQHDLPFFQRVCYAADGHVRFAFEALEVRIARCLVLRNFLSFQQRKQNEVETILPEQYLIN